MVCDAIGISYKHAVIVDIIIAIVVELFQSLLMEFSEHWRYLLVS